LRNISCASGNVIKISFTGDHFLLQSRKLVERLPYVGDVFGVRLFLGRDVLLEKYFQTDRLVAAVVVGKELVNNAGQAFLERRRIQSFKRFHRFCDA
jgi:hypothetical protein